MEKESQGTKVIGTMGWAAQPRAMPCVKYLTALLMALLSQ